MLFEAPIRLFCRTCGRDDEDRGQIPRCAACGGPLDLRLDPLAAASPPDGQADPSRPVGRRPGASDDAPRRGVWRYRRLLPLIDERNIVTLGEGATPIVELPRYGRALGLAHLSAKLEHAAPTGSFKDRGMTLVVSRARELGARRLVEDSSGNAGASTAAYAARAGIPATVYVPAGAPAAKIAQIAAAGAEVIPVEGPRERVTEVAMAACGPESYYVGHNLNPFFAFGMTTVAYELVEALGQNRPRHIVMPAGGGSIYVGCWRGLRAWLGPTATLPRLHLVQPTGCQPIVAAQASGARQAVPIVRAPTIAGGAEIEHPARGDQMLAALADSAGVAVAVDDTSLRAERRRLAHLEGIDLEPTAALALAGLVELIRRNVIQPDEPVLLVTTGQGLKVPDDGL